MGRIREAELRAAAAILRMRGLTLLRYPDGRLATADPAEVIARIAQAVRQPARIGAILLNVVDSAYAPTIRLLLRRESTGGA